MDRRNFLTAGIAATTMLASTGQTPAKAANDRNVRIVGVSCSPRKGKTTATSVNVALEAAKAVDPRIKIQLLDMGGMEISGWAGGAKPTDSQLPKDNFDLMVLPMLRDPVPNGLIIGSPSYFRSMSALCKAYKDDIAKDEFGIETAKQLGIRVAEAALRLARK